MKKLLTFIGVATLFGLQYALSQSSDTIAIENVNVIPMTQDMVLENQRVLVSKGKIVKIEPASFRRNYKATLTISGKGKYLIPGLSEMHYHFRSNDIASDLKLLIANGITTVRNMAEFEGQDQIEIRDKIKTGQLPHINYFTAGPYLRSNDLPTIEKVTEVVQMHKRRGYDFLKVADDFPKDIYLTLLQEAQTQNIPIVGHAQRNQDLEYSLRIKSIEHIEEFLYLKKSSHKDTYFKADTAELKSLITQIKQSGIHIGTTLTVFEFINDCLDDEKFNALKQSHLARYLAKKERTGFLTENNDYRKLKSREFDGVPAAKLFNNYFVWMKQFARRLAEAGVPLLTGSDTYGMVIVGFSLHREFELLQEAGIRPYDILLASTVNAARYLGTYPSEGTITEGKNANLVLLNENPLDDIRNTKTIKGVFVKGEWHDRHDLDSKLHEVELAFSK